MPILIPIRSFRQPVVQDRVSARELAEWLGENHTYLTINDGTGAEIVKAYAFGNEVKIERGQDGTQPKTFPAGACVKWEATKSGIEETICNADFKCSEKLKVEGGCD